VTEPSHRHQLGRILFAGTVGSSLSTTATVHAVFGTFLLPLSEAFNWSRASISAVMMIIAVSSAITYPLAGRFSDRHGSRRMIIFGNIVLSLAIAALALTNGSLIQFYLTFLAIGIFGSLPSTPMFARLVAEWFKEHRGFALGFSSGLGNGLGAVIMPIVAAILVSGEGWRAGYLGIAGIMLAVGVPVFYFFLHDPAPQDLDGAAETGAADMTGVSLREALRTRCFWLLIVAIAAGGGISTAVLSHVVPIVGDRGFSLTTGTAVVTIFALVASAWQIATGTLMDRSAGPRIVVPMYAMAIPGVLLLEYGTSNLHLVLGGVAMGITLGAQFGSLPFFIGRYFGLLNFGTILGVMYSAVIAAQGITPVLLDAAFDSAGTYRYAILAAAGVVAFGSLLLLLLPAYKGAGEMKGDFQLADAPQ